MDYGVNHQRGGFQRVNFRVIPSPLGVKVLISAEEAIFRRSLIYQYKMGSVKWGQASKTCITMGINGLEKLE